MSDLTQTPIRIVLVEDHAVFRAALRRFLGTAEDVVIVGEGATGTEAIELVTHLNPDILLLDVEIPVLKGDEVALKLRELEAGVRILAVSSHREARIIRRMLDSGAAGYITKDEVGQFLFVAIRFLMANQNAIWLSPEVKKRLGDYPISLTATK